MIAYEPLPTAVYRCSWWYKGNNAVSKYLYCNKMDWAAFFNELYQYHKLHSLSDCSMPTKIIKFVEFDASPKTPQPHKIAVASTKEEFQ